MPRKYKRVTSRLKPDAHTIKAAVMAVESGSLSLRAAAQEYTISKSSLQRKIKVNKETSYSNLYFDEQHKYIFNKTQEDELSIYLRQASNMHYGLDVRETKQLAYQYAIKNDIKIPENWKKSETAGTEWFYLFLNRTKLSIRTPEATSLSRTTSFNCTNVDTFFKNLDSVQKRYNFSADCIYNIDETGLTTVHKPVKVIAGKGVKQVGQVTSAERGTLVTMVGCINALGNFIPPFLIFPRVHFRSHMLKGAPTGTKGDANPSGWINAEIFLKWFDHFVEYGHPSKDHPLLLIMDNHKTHISIELMDKAKESNVVLLTLPPHCSHKLQPLDRSVFGPLKKFYNSACDSWLKAHPNTPMTIYDISENLGIAYTRAFTSQNIQNGFKAAGIFPYDPYVFSDVDFLCSHVSDRPIPANDNSDKQTIPTSLCIVSEVINEKKQQISTSAYHWTAEDIRPFPKAGERVAKRKSAKRKCSRSLVLTDTPTRNELVESLSECKRKKEDKDKKKKKSYPLRHQRNFDSI